MWARNANLAATTLTWSNAVLYCQAVAGLGWFGYHDWRLPNRRELLSLIDDGRINPALCNTTGAAKWAEGDPFTGVMTSNYYWSSTSHANDSTYAWRIAFFDGKEDAGLKTSTNWYYVWPVRGGQ